MKVLTERQSFLSRDARSIIETMNIETGEQTVIMRFPFCVEAPNWTGDGKHLVYNAGGLLYRISIEEKTISQIDSAYLTACNNDHVLSPDGGSIAVSHHTAEDGQSRVYIIPLSGGSPRLITPMAPSYLHGWSPDGATLAYCAERNGEYDIYTIPACGGIEARLTDTPGLNDGPEYTPDGQYIWFNSVRSGLMQLYRMRPDGNEQTRMTFDERNNWFAHVSPDGARVAYLSYRSDEVMPGDHPANKHVEIRVMPSQGGAPQTLVALFGGQGTINVNSWSPDSKQLAYVRYELSGA